MLDGKHRGGNVQREKFAAGASKGKPEPKGGRGVEGESDTMRHETPGSSGTTTITHNGDGSHTVSHADGETSEHPSTGHMLMHLHSKHSMGAGMHHDVHPEGSVTSHHVGHDGMVEGPHEHGSVGEAAQHMTQTLGEDGSGPMGNDMHSASPAAMHASGGGVENLY